MTNSATPQGGEAQPIADANPIDAIVDEAVAESNKIPKEAPETEIPESTSETEEAWPKKAENALAKAKGKAAQLRAERDQERAARQRLEQQLAQYSQPQNKNNNVQKNGEPKDTDFENFADYIDARNTYRIEQKFAEQEGKQKQVAQTEQQQRWVQEREISVKTQTADFVKQNPEIKDEIISLVEEYGDLIDELPPQIQTVFLEADNAPLAFFNLAKEGRLEALASMSPAKAAMEIGRAQTQALVKPKTKAPTPLPASRGSVASGKRPEDMSGSEIRSWLRSENS